MASASLSLGTAPVAMQPAAMLVTPAPVIVAPVPAPAVVMPDPNRPWPPVLETPIGQTVCNYVSLCRNYHSMAFLIYGVLLILVIIFVWMAKNGISPFTLFNTAVAITVIIAALIIFTFIHWYWFIKGVVPECAMGGFNVSGSISATAGARTRVVTTPIVAPVVTQQTTTTTTVAATPVAATTTVAATPVAATATVAAVDTPVAAASGGGSHAPYYYNQPY
jgi:hypothetical protein